VADKQRLAARPLLDLLITVKTKNQNQGDKGVEPNKISRQTQPTSKAPDMFQTMVSMTIHRDCTECLRSLSMYS
jgi:hypothetical protein